MKIALADENGTLGEALAQLRAMGLLAPRGAIEVTKAMDA